MVDQVAVRLVVVGGAQFKGEMAAAGAAGEQAMGRVAAGSRRVGFAAQNAAFQIGDFAVQVAGGTSAARAFAQQAPQLLGSFGLIGALGGAAVAVLAAMAPLLFKGSEGASEMAGRMTDLEGSVGSVDSAMAALRDTQNAYTDAINASGGASSASASLVIANSAAEFAARKEVLAVELELLRIRGVEKGRDLQNLKDQYAAGAAAAAAADDAYRYSTKGKTYTGFAARRVSVGTPNLDAYYRAQEQTRLAMRKIEAETTLDRLALEKGDSLLNTEFKGIGTGAGKPGRGGGGGKGGGSAANKVLEEGRKLFESTRTSAEKYATEQAKLNDLLAKGAIDQDTYNRGMADLRDQFDATRKGALEVGEAFKGAFRDLFTGIADGSANVSEILTNLAKKLAIARLEASAFNVLGQVFPNILGAGGSIPLVASARGNVFDHGSLVAFASGGVVTSPHMFPMRGGRMGLMGEAGPEGILPLARIGGKLGVNAAGLGGGAPVSVNIFNNSGQQVRQSERQGPDGGRIIDVHVGESIASGKHDKAMRARYGIGAGQVKR